MDVGHLGLLLDQLALLSQVRIVHKMQFLKPFCLAVVRNV